LLLREQTFVMFCFPGGMICLMMCHWVVKRCEGPAFPVTESGAFFVRATRSTGVAHEITAES